ncbi:hypothetical protein [Hasllibacter sp. MH4015]|uniref:hypothetical protein n=1 Tax=Hasllibacter sp. MH4015 TaxID=2854029 RepID=UPI001CD2D0F3|nr:hypothetical protein [Hasllibacter sp. MH4015]
MSGTAPPARLHVIPAIACDKALILRRGPTRQVASMLWDRRSGAIEMGQWLKGTIYVHKSDLSPDGRHMIVFAGQGGRYWTAISRAPWLSAIAYWPFDETWFGGGAFTRDGLVFGNGFAVPKPLPDGLHPAPEDAYPSGTDGFHMGLFFPAMLEARGWRITGGERYDVTLEKPLRGHWSLRLRFEHGFRTKGSLSNPVYTLVRGDAAVEMPDWEWAEPWDDGIQVARMGGLYGMKLGRNGLSDEVRLHDFNDMTFEPRQAPYEGIRA